MTPVPPIWRTREVSRPATHRDFCEMFWTVTSIHSSMIVSPSRQTRSPAALDRNALTSSSV